MNQTPTSPGASATGRKVLVIDDNPVVVKSLALKLKSKGYEVFEAGNGSDAVRVAREQKPDIILLDINFPEDFGSVEWDGFRIMDWLRRVNMERPIPIIIITGGEPAKYRDRALKCGASAFFQKPVNNEELLATMQQILARIPVPTPEPKL